MAITEYNLHGGDQKPTANKSHSIMKMQKPYYFDHARELRQNRMLLREAAKDNQIFTNHFVSEDLLIRSHKEIQKNILPYMKEMGGYSILKDAAFLAEFSRRGGYNNNRYGGNAGKGGGALEDDDARDNFKQDLKLEEVEREEQRRKQKRAFIYSAKNNKDAVQNGGKASATNPSEFLRPGVVTVTQNVGYTLPPVPQPPLP